jgi:UDP-N-acetylglucosamine 2-epimerase
LLLCPSATATENLAAEGITNGVHLVGDVMLDVLNWAKERSAPKAPETLNKHGLKKNGYLMATVHRSENTDDPHRLINILDAFNALEEPVLFPAHPRFRKVLAEGRHQLKPHIKLIEPLGYFDMVTMTGSARMVLTDSGGLQKEAYWLGVPCVTLRDETEWVETVETGWNRLAGFDRDSIVNTIRTFAPPAARPALYGEGCVSAKCVALLK